MIVLDSSIITVIIHIFVIIIIVVITMVAFSFFYKMGPQSLHRLYCHLNAIKFNLIGFHKTRKDKMQRQGKTKS